VETEMTDAEVFVRKHWGDCTAGNESYLSVFFNYKWNVSLNRDLFVFPQFDTEAEAWSAAAEFTMERLNKIEEVEEEVKQIEGAMWTAETTAANVLLGKAGWVRRSKVWQRILASRQVALAELKKGMK
jgi:hypothetical protein